MNNYVKRDNFYIFLPSNSSMDVFPKNRQSQYSTQLASPIELEGRWEVGLAEIHIPTDWMNITSLNNSFTLRYSKSMPVMIKHSAVKYDPGMFKFDMKFYKNYTTQFQYLRLMEAIIREHSSYALSTVNWADALNLSYKTLGGKVFGFLKLKEGFSLYIGATKENDEVLRKRIFATPSLAVNTFIPGPFLIEIGEIDNDNMLTISQHNMFVASNVNKAVVSETEQLETRDVEHVTNITIPTGCYKSRLDLINALNHAVNPFCDEKLLFSLRE